MTLPHPALRTRPTPPASRRVLAAGCLFASLWATVASAAATADDPRGRWLTANGNLEVDVAPCGAALCGTVSRVLANRSMSGSGEAMTPVDSRPALGLQLLSGFVPTAGDAAAPAWTGTLYNRENGKTYRCTMALGPAGELVLRPYIGLPLFGQTLLWTRVRPAAAATASQP